MSSEATEGEEGFDFADLETEIWEDRVREQTQDQRTRDRYISEMAAGILVDAIQAGLPKDVARAFMISALENISGYKLKGVQ